MKYIYTQWLEKRLSLLPSESQDQNGFAIFRQVRGKEKYVCLFRYKERGKCLTLQPLLLVHVLLTHLEKHPKDLSVKAPVRLILRVKIIIAGLILDNDSGFYPSRNRRRHLRFTLNCMYGYFCTYQTFVDNKSCKRL